MKGTYLKDDEVNTVTRALYEVMVQIENGVLESEDEEELWSWHDKMGDVLKVITGRESLEDIDYIIL